MNVCPIEDSEASMPHQSSRQDMPSCPGGGGGRRRGRTTGGGREGRPRARRASAQLGPRLRACWGRPAGRSPAGGRADWGAGRRALARQRWAAPRPPPAARPAPPQHISPRRSTQASAAHHSQQLRRMYSAASRSPPPQPSPPRNPPPSPHRRPRPPRPRRPRGRRRHRWAALHPRSRTSGATPPSASLAPARRAVTGRCIRGTVHSLSKERTRRTRHDHNPTTHAKQ